MLSLLWTSTDALQSEKGCPLISIIAIEQVESFDANISAIIGVPAGFLHPLQPRVTDAAERVGLSLPDENEIVR